MSHQIINLTLPFVLQEIESILEDYPKYPYQVTFGIEKFRQKLIAYVLSNMPNRFTVIDDSEELFKDNKFLSHPIKERLHIENLIHKGIFHVFRENADSLSFMMPQQSYSMN